MEIMKNLSANGLLISFILFCSWQWQVSDASGTFGFDFHHRYSDAVKGILDLDGLPEKGTIDYYAAMAHRDRFIRGRNLAETASNSSNLVFANSNFTHFSPALGFLHYANITVGTPNLWFLVALDTGSDLFWLPCNCTNCVRGLRTRNGEINFNMYSLTTSSTGLKTPCNSTFCGGRSGQCPSQSSCGYKIQYLSNGTSSSGILVNDFLHLATDDSKSNAIDAPITFGCGIVQTGSFLQTGAPNGLFGLGVEDISVPSILASQGLTANSFSMCFGTDGPGRISFGDKGSNDQSETPFDFNQPHRSYNVSVTGLTVEKKFSDVNFTAIFDSGTSFTFLNDPAYTALSESFNSEALDKRYPTDSNSIPFEYCYSISANQTIMFPEINLTMKGGDVFSVLDPIALFSDDAGTYIYCLTVIKSGDINIIGQNFMTGYRVIFDREKKALGWIASDCYNIRGSSTTFVNPRNTTTAVSPSPSSVKPEGAIVPPPPSSNDASITRNSLVWEFLSILVMFFIHVFY
ncbi:aspartyl protease family protein 1 [Impatiens glandulifera]|uniref:aspartyl protease family protein 1 n=1 Tax=Impatiens glandulifera TaxID=253017 RepID=UPI001FB195B0|nr:aspartyl protease family protein 1 [Impatiens glandulifera]